MSEPQPKPEIIMKLRDAVVPSYALLAALELDLFTALKDGPRTGKILAEALGASQEKLEVLLYALVQTGLLSATGQGFANTAESACFLVKGSSEYLGGMFQALPERWNAISKTAESIRSGEARAKVDYSNMSPDELELHYRGFYSATVARGRELLQRYDFADAKHLLDLGGGTGGLAIAMTQALPHLRATIVDLPSVVPVAQGFVDRSGGADRVRVVGADFLQDRLPGNFDVAVMGAIFPVLAPTEIGRALENVYQAMEAGGRLFISDGGFLDESRISPPGAIANNLWFINAFDRGGARTVAERLEWLGDAGFVVVEQFTLPNGFGMMVARKPD